MSETLFQSGICQGISPDAAAALQDLVTPVYFGKDRALFVQGDAGDQLYVVTTGQVRISQRTRDGRRAVLMIAGPSDVIGALSLFDPGPRTTTADAVTDVEAEAMDRVALQTWITRCPEISEQLLQVLARRLRRTNTMISDLIFTDVPARVAKTLLQLAGQFGTRTGTMLQVEHNLTQTDLAELVGASRETVNKALGDFAARGWLRLESGGVEILQPARLARRAR